MFFEMIYETNLFGLITVFASGVAVGLLCAAGIFKLLQRRDAYLRLQAQVNERNQERVARLRAERAWDTT